MSAVSMKLPGMLPDARVFQEGFVPSNPLDLGDEVEKELPFTLIPAELSVAMGFTPLSWV